MDTHFLMNMEEDSLSFPPYYLENYEREKKSRNSKGKAWVIQNYFNTFHISFHYLFQKNIKEYLWSFISAYY